MELKSAGEPMKRLHDLSGTLDFRGSRFLLIHAKEDQRSIDNGTELACTL